MGDEMKEFVKYANTRIIKIIAKDINKKGTGFIVSEDGLVLTNFHVIYGGQDPNGGAIISRIIDVECNGKIYSAEIFDLSQDNIDYKFNYDFCILKIKSDNKFDFFELGSYNEAELGDDILFAGYPLTQDYLTYHKGVISCVRKSRTRNGLGEMNVLDLDATVVKGNSGGPLVKKIEGSFKVIGIISSEVAAITREYNNLANYLQTQLKNPNSGAVFIAGVNPNAALLETINFINNNLSTGIGTAIAIDYSKNKLNILA